MAPEGCVWVCAGVCVGICILVWVCVGMYRVCVRIRYCVCVCVCGGQGRIPGIAVHQCSCVLTTVSVVWCVLWCVCVVCVCVGLFVLY